MRTPLWLEAHELDELLDVVETRRLYERLVEARETLAASERARDDAVAALERDKWNADMERLLADGGL